MTSTQTTTDNSRGGDGRPIVLFAIEPHSYAQAIGSTVGLLRPELDVRVVEPEDLVAEMERLAPSLVFCGEERPDGCAEAVRWAEFRPYDEPDVVRVDGRPESFPGLDLEDILELVDRLAAPSAARDA